jgi:hypothetical protein
MVTPAGRLSVNATPVSATEFELLIVRVSELPEFTVIVEGLKDLLMLGAAIAFTVTLALPVLPVPPSLEVTALVTLFF